MTVRHDNLTVEWLGYATARLETIDGAVAYTDPGRYDVLADYWGKDADLVVITHNHHYSTDGIRSVAGDDATLVIYEGVDASEIDRDVDPVDELATEFEVVRVAEEDRVTVGDATIWSIPAYNDPTGPNATDGEVSHPPGFGCGFLLSLSGTTVFWQGDSDALDGFAELDVSLYLANIGGGGIVSDRHQAADLAERMDPDLVVPIHYDTFEQLEADDEAFAADVASRSLPVALDKRSANQ